MGNFARTLRVVVSGNAIAVPVSSILKIAQSSTSVVVTLIDGTTTYTIANQTVDNVCRNLNILTAAGPYTAT